MSFEIYKIGLKSKPESYTIFFSLFKISTSSRSSNPHGYIPLHFLIFVNFPILFTLATLQGISYMWTSIIIAGKCCVPYLGQWIANMQPLPKASSKMIQWGKETLATYIYVYFYVMLLNLHFECI